MQKTSWWESVVYSRIEKIMATICFLALFFSGILLHSCMQSVFLRLVILDLGIVLAITLLTLTVLLAYLA